MNIRFISLSLLFFILTSCSEPHSSTDKTDTVYAAIARGKIDVEGGLLNIAAPSDSRFNDINVKLGDEVKAGDVLAKLNDENELLGVELVEADVQHAQAELDALNGRLQYTQHLAERWSTAVTAGVAEQQQVDEMQQTLAQLHADINIAKNTLGTAAIKRKQANIALSQRTLRASQNAKVIKVFAQKGSVLIANQGLNQGIAFILLPAKPFIVRAEVNESFISRVHQNSTAIVTLESNLQASPIKAKVISVGATLDISHWNEEQQQPSRVIECILAIDQQQNLLVGQNVMVKFNE